MNSRKWQLHCSFRPKKEQDLWRQKVAVLVFIWSQVRCLSILFSTSSEDVIKVLAPKYCLCWLKLKRKFPTFFSVLWLSNLKNYLEDSCCVRDSHSPALWPGVVLHLKQWQLFPTYSPPLSSVTVSWPPGVSSVPINQRHNGNSAGDL